MNAPIYVAPPTVATQAMPPAAGEVAELLRQLIDVQRLQVDLLRAQAAQADERAKWQNFFSRWSQEFPQLPEQARQFLPKLERAYLMMVQDVLERVADEDTDHLGNEYATAEFLDRYGLRLNQLAAILGQVSHLANLAPPP